MRFYQDGPGEVSAEFTVPEHFQGYPGVVHGGIVAAMLDEIAGRVHISEDPPRFMYTARMEVRYRRNVPVGQQLRLVGKVGKSRERTASATASIYSAQGELLAEAEVLLVNVPDSTLASSELEALGWKVYPVDTLHIE
jgi:uncharacterized protein (TIGR00369 family)